MNVVAIIQARMGSTRLPGKVLMDLAGEPMLARVVNRCRRAHTLHETVIATTMQPADKAIAQLCRDRGWPCERGSQDDVLDRYYRAAVNYKADAVVRITADCPLIDPAVVDTIVSEFTQRQPEISYASNVFPIRTFPRGLDVEVMLFAALASAWREDGNPAWREHVTPYIRDNQDRFAAHSVTNSEDCSSQRWTVDTPEDFELVQLIYRHFGHDRFSWREAMALLDRYPEWLEINRHIVQKVL